MTTTINNPQPATALEKNLLATLEHEITSNQLVLPSLPEIILKVRELLARADCSAHELARLIRSDAALTARIIKVANSSSYRGHKEIDNLQAAITRLGTQLVRSLVTQLALLQSMRGSDASINRALTVLTRHSTLIAAYSQAIARRYSTLDSEEALLAGLVHDIGKLTLLQRLHALGGAGELADHILSRLHGRVGSMILQAWRFSKELTVIPEEYERWQEISHTTLDYTEIVKLAHLLLKLQQTRRPEAMAHLPVFRHLQQAPEQVLADPLLQEYIKAAQERLAF